MFIVSKYGLNATMWREEWREHLQVKFFQERIWLEKRVEALQNIMSRELDHRMELFKAEWRKEEERRREEEENNSCVDELKEYLRERQIKEDEMRQKERALEVTLEEVRGMLKELQKQKEEYQTVQQELKKIQVERIKIETEKREIKREKERLREEQERIAAQERILLMEVAKQWKTTALEQHEEIRHDREREMERWRVMEEKLLQARKNEELVRERMKLEEEKRRASMENELQKERYKKMVEEERKMMQKKTRMIAKEWKNIGMEMVNIETEKEALEKEKETERVMHVYRESLTEKEMQRQKTKMERMEKVRRMVTEEEWRAIDAEKVKIEEERNAVEREKKQAEKEIRRQRKRLEREEEERKRREQDEIKREDVIAIAREEILFQKEKQEKDCKNLEKESALNKLVEEERKPLVKTKRGKEKSVEMERVCCTHPGKHTWHRHHVRPSPLLQCRTRETECCVLLPMYGGTPCLGCDGLKASQCGELLGSSISAPPPAFLSTRCACQTIILSSAVSSKCHWRAVTNTARPPRCSVIQAFSSQL
ncbi:golgin subfamily A member 6-like protein 22 [Colossoma macropomum]|uniref:golgin subfamily A member 6-like protein 22 n=1 Tax=Colossoma macropomum TaxID=42526 RepID=UPI001864A38D|nr:golgin subfamily A member 6-like protein 22 [Colossoma macropomum]